MKNIPAIRQSIEMGKDEVRFWKSEIQASLKRQRDEFINRIGYDELVRYYEALQVAEGANINQMAIVDEFSPGISSIINQSYYQNPSVRATALKPEADGLVKPSLLYQIQNPQFKPFKLSDLMESATKYGMKKIGLKDEMRLAVFDFLVAGFATAEVNYLSEAQEDPVQADTVEANPADKILDGVKGIFDKVKSAITKDQVEEQVSQEVQNERVDTSDVTYCKRWNPLDVLFDSKAVVFKDSRFVGKIVRMSLADFNTHYPKFKGRIQPGSEITSDMMYQAHNNPEHKKQVTLYSIEIKKKTGRNCVLVVANGIDEAVDYYEDPVITNGFKLKYRAVDNYGKIYPMSRAKKAKKPQDDINHYMTIQFEHVDRAMRKIAVYMGGLTPAGQAAQRSSDVYALVEKSTPQTVYEPMPAPSVVPENKEIVGLMKDSINKALQTTETAKSGKSDNEFATQDVLENQSFQSSTSAVSDALGDLANDLIETLKDIILQFWDGEDYFKVTGVMGAEQWYDPSMGPLADVLIGDYEVVADIVTAQRPNPMKDRQDAVEYSAFITSPQTVQFAAMHGKRPSMAALNAVVKQFGQNPETAFDDLEPMGMPGPLGAPGAVPAGPGQPNVTPVPSAQEPQTEVAQNVPGL